MQLDEVRSGTSHRNKKIDRLQLLQKLLSHAYTESKSRTLKWTAAVKRDIMALCNTAAVFDLNKQWQDYPLVAAPSLRKRWRKGRLKVSIRQSQVMQWMTQL